MLNSTRYVYHIKKKPKFRVLIVIVSIVIVAATAGYFLFSRGASGPRRGNEEAAINELWNNKNYDEIIALSEKHLPKDPFNHLFLTFRGISYFYKSKVEPEKRDAYLNSAIFSLRRARIVSGNRYAGEINYVLGLAYFLKGKYYYDSAARSMETSLRSGYLGIDTYKCLGLAYGGLGNTEKELVYFLEALKEEESAVSLLAVGKAYMKKNRNDEAVDYIIRALDKADDDSIRKECRSHLGDIYLQRKDYPRAEEQFLEIIKIDPGASTAYFNLGEIYFYQNDLVKARAFWRKTLIYDPSHYGAKLRYYK